MARLGISDQISQVLLAQEPGKAVLAALEQLLAKDDYLLEVDANERSITHRFGMYLQDQMPEWHIDCEYNRNNIDPKRLGHIDIHPDQEDGDGKTVFPDLIAHIRGTAKNYLIIECKKTSSQVDREIDLQKLRGYKADERLGYKHALFVEFAVGRSPAIAVVEWM